MQNTKATDTHNSLSPKDQMLDHTPRGDSLPLTPVLSDSEEYRLAMISQRHAHDSPSSQPPGSMRNFITQKSLNPRGQDLATLLDKADLEWKMREAERIRLGKLRVEQGSMGGSTDSESRTPMGLGRISPRSVAPPPGPPPMGALPPTPISETLLPTGRQPAGSPPLSQLPAVPPPVAPLPPTPIDLGLKTEQGPPAMPSLGKVVSSSGSHASAVDEAGKMGQLKLTDGPSRDQLVTPEPVLRRQGTLDSFRSMAGTGEGDTESINSKASSAARARRRLQKQQPVDLSECYFLDFD